MRFSKKATFNSLLLAENRASFDRKAFADILVSATVIKSVTETGKASWQYIFIGWVQPDEF